MSENDGSFVIRLPKEDLEKFNEVVKSNAVNRSELIRQWIQQYIKEESK